MPKRKPIDLDPKRMAAAEGCWVMIWEDEGFADTSLLVPGPAEFPNLRNLLNSGKDWGDDIDSLHTGWRCWLQVFADENFQDTSAWYGPNTLVPGLGDMGDEIDSMKLFKDPPAAYFEWLRRSHKEPVR